MDAETNGKEPASGPLPGDPVGHSVKDNAAAVRARPVTIETANVFTGILLALILKTSLDAFCKNIGSYASIAPLWAGVKANQEWSVLVSLQLLVFIFTVARFYWGTVRYHEEVPASGGTPHFLVGLAGAIFVFIVFYVTALLVKRPGLFYWSFCVALFIDLAWFLFVARIVDVQVEIGTIWKWYVGFDLLTLVPVGVLQVLGHVCSKVQYASDLGSLIVIAAVGVWDLRIFWPYYTKKDGWRETLPSRIA